VTAVVDRIDGPAPERQIARDLTKRALWIAPVMILLWGVIWGLHGAASAALALAIVSINFLVSAALITYTARISLGLMMGVVLFGYLIRLGVILVVMLTVKDAAWVNLTALGIAIIVTQLGLLLWELKYVSASLAFPGLKPSK
jgi:hypothetical protein